MTAAAGSGSGADGERAALATLIARFTGDRDELARAVRACEERLDAVQAAVRAAGDDLRALRADVGGVRETAAALAAAVTRENTSAGWRDGLAEASGALERRLEALVADAIGATAAAERGLTERVTAVAREVEDLRGNLRRLVADEVRAAGARLATETAGTLSRLDATVTRHAEALESDARELSALQTTADGAARDAAAALAEARGHGTHGALLAQRLEETARDLGARADAGLDGVRTDALRARRVLEDRLAAAEERVLACEGRVATLYEALPARAREAASQLAEVRAELGEARERAGRVAARLETVAAAQQDVRRRLDESPLTFLLARAQGEVRQALAAVAGIRTALGRLLAATLAGPWGPRAGRGA